jgi:hypothetical protein
VFVCVVIAMKLILLIPGHVAIRAGLAGYVCVVVYMCERSRGSFSSVRIHWDRLQCNIMITIRDSGGHAGVLATAWTSVILEEWTS